MKVAYATIVYKNRRQKYYLFLYKPQIFCNSLKLFWTLFLLSLKFHLKVVSLPRFSVNEALSIHIQLEKS